MRNLNYADSSFTLVHRRPAKQTVRNKIIKYKHNEFTQIRSSHTGNVHTDLIRAFANTVKWMRLTYTTYLDEVQKQPTDQILMVIVRMIFIKLGPLPIFTSSWLSTKTARASFKIAKKGPDLSHRNPPARNLNSESIGKLGALLIVKKNWRTAGEESKMAILKDFHHISIRVLLRVFNQTFLTSWPYLVASTSLHKFEVHTENAHTDFIRAFTNTV